MSNLVRSNGDDYPAAAKKHLNDAKVLLDAQRFDGAVYLSGFAIECALRTIVMMGYMHREATTEAAEKRRGSVPLKRAFVVGSRAMAFKSVAAKQAQADGRDHDLAALEAAATGYKDGLNDGTACYVPASNVKKLPFQRLEKFIDIRYRAEGVMKENDAAKWFEEAHNVYSASVGAMIRDGLIK